MFVNLLFDVHFNEIYELFQGLISRLYGGMKIQGTSFFMKNSLTATILWKRQLSATMTIFSRLWTPLFSNFINRCFKNTKYFVWLNVDKVPIIPSTSSALWATMKLALNSVGLLIILPDLTHPRPTIHVRGISVD